MKTIMRISVNIFCIFMMMLFCGCEKARQIESGEENKTIDYYDWRENGLAINQDVSMDESYFLGEYNKWNHESDDCSGLFYIDSGVKDDFFWYFAGFRDDNGNWMTGSEGSYLLEKYWINQGKIDKKVFKPSDIGVEGELGYLIGMDCMDDGKFMLRWAAYEKNEENLYCQCKDDIIVTDFKGNDLIVDFKHQFAEDQLEEYPQRELPMLPNVKCHVFENDNIWALSSIVPGRQIICCYDQTGKRLLKKEAGEHEYFMQPFFNQDEEMLLPIRNTENNEIHIFWYDLTAEKMKDIGYVNDKSNDIKNFCRMDNHFIYYEAADPNAGIRLGIVQWDISSGNRTWMLGIDISNYLQYKAWWFFSGGKIESGLLTWEEHKNTEDWVVSVSDQENVGNADVRVADFTGESGKLKTCCSVASMGNPGKTYRYEDVSSNDKRNLINLELSQNKGPDIMFVSMKEFYELNEKGLLLDLSDLLSDEILNGLLPGVTQIGRTDDGLMGIPIGVHVETFMLGKEVGDPTDWSLASVIDLMEQGRLNTSIWSPYIINSYLEPALTVQLLTNYSMSNSFLIDWDTKKCHFDDDRFVRLLEMTKKDKSKTVRSENEKNDLTWVYLNSYVNLVDFLVEYPDEGVIVGFPGQAANTGYLMADQGILVVNKNNNDKESIRFFLGKILSKEIQKAPGSNPELNILKFEPKDYVTTDEDGKKYYFNKLLAEKFENVDPQDNPFLQAVSFLNECKPAPKAYFDIRVILSEELQSLYAGSKDAKSVADIINNRVQLYFNE